MVDWLLLSHLRSFVWIGYLLVRRLSGRARCTGQRYLAQWILYVLLISIVCEFIDEGVVVIAFLGELGTGQWILVFHLVLNLLNFDAQDYTSNPPSLCLRNGTTCGQGNVPVYAINVTEVRHAQVNLVYPTRIRRPADHNNTEFKKRPA